MREGDRVEGSGFLGGSLGGEALIAACDPVGHSTVGFTLILSYSGIPGKDSNTLGALFLFYIHWEYTRSDIPSH